jgi:hypothetical protein
MLVALFPLLLSCNLGSNQSNRASEANAPRLCEQTIQFIENYFIALNVINDVNRRNDHGSFSEITRLEFLREFLRLNSITDVLRAVRTKGYTDIRHAYTVLDFQWFFQYIEPLLIDLGFDRGRDDFYYLWYAFIALYSENSNWRMPELQSTLVETLDNGTEIWQVRDFVTMRQARLSVGANGSLNIGNAERFSLGD